jgi:hypothetical protein
MLRQHFFSLFLIVLIASLTLAPIASNVLLPNSGDIINHLSAIVQAKMALAEGQFPIRVMPFLNARLRYPFYQFYSPTANMFAGMIFWITPSNPYIAFKCSVWFASLLGGIYMYRLSNILVNAKYAALAASAVYMTSPYYLIVLDHLYDFTESVALGFLPVVLFYTVQFFYSPKNLKLFLMSALVWYLLATIHLITFLYASITVALLLTLFTLTRRSYWRNLQSVGASFVLAFFLCAWYLIPVMLLKKYLRVELYYGTQALLNGYGTNLSSLLLPFANISDSLPSSKHITNVLLRIQPNLGLALLMGICASVYIFFKNEKITAPAYHWLRRFIFGLCCRVFLPWVNTVGGC